MPNEGGAVVPKLERQRLSINLPTPVLDELRALADSSHRSMTELVKDAFALAKIAYEEKQRGNKIAITDSDGKLIKELVMPT
jgi:hypothetical protein